MRKTKGERKKKDNNGLKNTRKTRIKPLKGHPSLSTSGPPTPTRVVGCGAGPRARSRASRRRLQWWLQNPRSCLNGPLPAAAAHASSAGQLSERWRRTRGHRPGSTAGAGGPPCSGSGACSQRSEPVHVPDEWASPYTSDGAAARLFCVASYVAEREKGGGSEALFFFILRA